VWGIHPSGHSAPLVRRFPTGVQQLNELPLFFPLYGFDGDVFHVWTKIFCVAIAIEEIVNHAVQHLVRVYLVWYRQFDKNLFHCLFLFFVVWHTVDAGVDDDCGLDIVFDAQHPVVRVPSVFALVAVPVGQFA
jgi:hypothetical protein